MINPFNGRVEHAQVFDTYKTSQDLENFISNEIDNINIVAAACKDDCVSNLSDRCKMWFAEMGSEEIWNLEFRHGFAFIGVIGKSHPNEKRAKRVNIAVGVTQIVNVNDEYLES